MKRLIAFLLVAVCGIALGHTDTTTVGRFELIHPDLGYQGGAGLHGVVRTAWTKIADESNSRWKEVTVGDTDTETITHGLDVVFGDLRVILYDGQDSSATRITKFTTPASSDFTVAANGGNPRTQIDITNNSGGSEDLSVLILHADEYFPDISVENYVYMLDQGEMRYREDPGNGSNYVGFKAPADISANKVWTLPDADGANGQALTTDGAGVLEWKAAAGGVGINYVDNFDFESTVSGVAPNGWDTYVDAAGTKPVDGTGGTANVTFLANNSSPRLGLISAVITKDAADRQGEGASYDFQVDAQFSDSPQMMKIAFFYEASANFDFGDYSDCASDPSDVTVWIYDKDAAARMELLSSYCLSGAGYFEGVFQPQAGSDDYRLIFHISGTTATTWTFKMDNVTVGPQRKVIGPAMEDYKDYSDSFQLVDNNSGSELTSYTKTFVEGKRVGDSLHLIARFTSNTDRATDTDDVAIEFVGLAVDENKAGSTASLGGGFFYDASGSGDKKQEISTEYITASNYLIPFIDNARINVEDFDTADQLNFTLEIPISGWSSNTILSSEGESRKVEGIASTAVAETIQTSLTFVKLATERDSHNAFTHNNTGTTAATDGTSFTAPVAGLYSVFVGFNLTSHAYTAGDNLSLNLYSDVSGSYVRYRVIGNRDIETTASYFVALLGNTSIYLNAGESIKVAISQDSGSTVNLRNNAEWNYFNIHRVSDPSAIAASETVVVVANISSDTLAIGATDTTVIFDNETRDTHNTYNNATGEFTAPVAGDYLVTSVLTAEAAQWTGGDDFASKIYLDGVADGVLGYHEFHVNSTASVRTTITGSVIVPNVSKGSVITIRAFENHSSALDYHATDTNSHMSIHRIGGVM